MQWISGCHYFLYLFTNSTSQHVPVTALKFKVVIVTGRIIVRSHKIRNLIGQYRSRGNVRLLGIKYIRWYSNTKSDKYFMYLF